MPRGEVRARRRRRGPQAERAVDVHPGAGRVRARADLGERIERAGVHVAGLQRRRSSGRRAAAARRRACGPARRPARARRGCARGRAAPSALNSVGCASSPTTTVIGGAPNSPSASTSQPARCEHRVARGGERGEVGHRGAGDEGAARSPRGRPSSVEQPAQRDRLERGGRGRRRVAGRRSGPTRRRASSRPAPPGSEPPMTKPKKRGPAIAIVAGEPISSSSASTSAGVARAVRERLAQRLEPRDGLGRRRDVALLDLAPGSAPRESAAPASNSFT